MKGWTLFNLLFSNKHNLLKKIAFTSHVKWQNYKIASHELNSLNISELEYSTYYHKGGSFHSDRINHPYFTLPL